MKEPRMRYATCHPDRQHQAKGLCSKCYDVARYKADPEKRLEAPRRWIKKHAEFNRQRATEWIKNNYTKHLERQRNRRAILKAGQNCKAKLESLRLEKSCFYCGDQLTPENFSTDHIIPLARGGKHTPENLVAACRYCNWSKGVKSLRNWKRGVTA